MKLSEVVKKVVDLGHKIRAYYDTELPRHHKAYPLLSPGETELPPPPEELELRSFLAGLPEDLAYQVLLLQGLTRISPFSVERMVERYQRLKADSLADALAVKLNEVTVAEDLEDAQKV